MMEAGWTPNSEAEPYATTLDQAAKAVLAQRRNAVAFSERGTRADVAKSGLRRASLKAVKTEEQSRWTLWASLRANSARPTRRSSVLT